MLSLDPQFFPTTPKILPFFWHSENVSYLSSIWAVALLKAQTNSVEN